MGLDVINQEQLDQFVQVLKKRLNELNQELRLAPSRRRLDREIEFDRRLINQSLNSILQYKTRGDIRVSQVKNSLFGLETPKLLNQFLEDLEKQQSPASPEIGNIETKTVPPPVQTVPEKQPEQVSVSSVSTIVGKETSKETPIQAMPVTVHEPASKAPTPAPVKQPKPVRQKPASSSPPELAVPKTATKKQYRQSKPGAKAPVLPESAEIERPVVQPQTPGSIKLSETALETTNLAAVTEEFEPVGAPIPVPEELRKQPEPVEKAPVYPAPEEQSEQSAQASVPVLERQPEPFTEVTAPPDSAELPEPVVEAAGSITPSKIQEDVEELPTPPVQEGISLLADASRLPEIAAPNPDSAPPITDTSPVVQPTPAAGTVAPKIQSLQEAWLANGAAGLAQQLEQEDPWGKTSRWTYEDKILLRNFLASCLEKLEENFLGWNFVLSKISAEDALYQRLVGKHEKLRQEFRDEIKKQLQTDPQSGLRSLCALWTRYPLDPILKQVIMEFLDYEFLFKDGHAEKTHETFNGLGKLPRAFKERIRLSVRNAKYYRMYPHDPEKAYKELLDKITKAGAEGQLNEEETTFIAAVRRSWFDQAQQKEDLAALQKVLALLPKDKWVEAEIVALGNLNKMYFQSVRNLVDTTSKEIQKGEQIERQRVGLAAKFMKNLQRQIDIDATLQEWNELIDEMRTWIEKTRQAGWNYECQRLESSLEKLIRVYTRIEELNT